MVLLKNNLKQYEANEMKQQLGPSKPEKVVTGPHKQSSFDHMGFVMTIQTHICYYAL